MLFYLFSQGVLSHSSWLNIFQPTDSTDLLSGPICSPLYIWTERLGVFIQNSGAFQRSLELRGLAIAYSAFGIPFKVSWMFVAWSQYQAEGLLPESCRPACDVWHTRVR